MSGRQAFGIVVGIACVGAALAGNLLPRPSTTAAIAVAPMTGGSTTDRHAPAVVASPASPASLLIPALAVDAAVEPVGLEKDGTMAMPARVQEAGWLRSGPVPGEIGNAVIAGHLDTVSGAPALFFHLSRLRAGQRVMIRDVRGSLFTFEVTAVRRYELSAFPLFAVFGPSKESRLQLVTCAGRYRPGLGYSERIVVFTRLLPAGAADTAVTSQS